MRVRHGGELRQFSEKFSVAERDILDFSSNTNPLGPPPAVKEIYEASFDDLRLYPDAGAVEFRREVARHFPLWPENVVAGNGAIELLGLVLGFLGPKKALLVEPAFLEYRRLLNLQGAEIRNLLLKEGEGFNFSLSGLINSLKGIEVLILGHPNNPTGTHLSKEEVRHLLQEARRRDVFVILDEAFVDWTPELSLGGEVRDDSHFFIIRSLTKFFSLAGIRAGYGLGPRRLIEKLEAHQIPWSCNRLAQKLAVAVLRDEDFARESRAWLIRERRELENGLQTLPWLRIYPSAANFLLARAGTGAGSENFQMIEQLGRQGIYLRDLSEFPGLGPSYFRMAVKRRLDNERLIQALKHCRARPDLPEDTGHPLAALEKKI